MKKRTLLILALTLVCVVCVSVACACDNVAIDTFELSDTLECFVGDKIDYDSVKLKVVYTDGSDKTATVKELGAEVSLEADTSKEGVARFQLTLGGKTRTFYLKVNAKEIVVVRTVTGIKILDSRSHYVLGESDGIVYDDVLIEVSYSDDSKERKTVKELQAEVTAEADLTKAGNTFYTVTYQGKSDTKNITVSKNGEPSADATVVSVEVINMPTEYERTAVIDYQNLDLKIVYSDGIVQYKKVKDVSGATVKSQADTNKSGDDYVYTSSYTVALNGKEDTVEISVINPVTSIEVIEPKTLYATGATVDYNALQVKVTFKYNNLVRQNSVANLKTSGLEIANTTVDTSFEGAKSFTVSFGGKSATVTLTVKAKIIAQMFESPAYYDAYRAKVTSATDSLSDFTFKDKIYEVGNVNKFVFRPIVNRAVSTMKDENPITKAALSVKGNDGSFTSVDENNVSAYVEIGDSANDKTRNTYKFTKEAANKTFRLAISLDGEFYDGSAQPITVEFTVIDGGYNAYDQMGMSVMNDLSTRIWAELWGCTASTDAQGNVTLTPGATPLQLEADDKPLYQYVGNVNWLIMHVGNLTLDASRLPQGYFWQTNDEGFDKAAQSIAKFYGNSVAEAKSALAGTMKNGTNGGGDDFADYVNQGFIYDTVLYTQNDKTVPSGTSPIIGEVGEHKGIFGTHKVSVSGNYNSIIIPYQSGTYRFICLTDTEAGNQVIDDDYPVPHWNVFDFWQAKHIINPTTTKDRIPTEGKPDSFEIKNIATTGNNPNKDSVTGITYSGPSFLYNESQKFTMSNVNANMFYTIANLEGCGNWYVNDGNTKEEGKVYTEAVTVDGCKLTDARSTMIGLWRRRVVASNSVMENAGGPIFIICSGNENHLDDANKDSYNDIKNGGSVDIQSTCTVRSYTVGNEDWYASYGAQALMTMITGPINSGIINSLGKTLIVKNDKNGQRLNLVAIMLNSPGSITSGGDHQLDTYGCVDLAGTHFSMQNDTLKALRSSPYINYDATNYPLIFQTGELFAYGKPDGVINVPNVSQNSADQWKASNEKYICMYMSAGNNFSDDNIPYIGCVFEVANV